MSGRLDSGTRNAGSVLVPRCPSLLGEVSGGRRQAGQRRHVSKRCRRQRWIESIVLFIPGIVPAAGTVGPTLERYPRDAANAIGGQSSAPVAESSFTGPEPTRIRTAASPSQMLLFGGVRDSLRPRYEALISRLFRQAGQASGLTRLWHRLGPRDMRFKAKCSRHAAVAVPRVSRGIPVSPRQWSL